MQQQDGGREVEVESRLATGCQLPTKQKASNPSNPGEDDPKSRLSLACVPLTKIAPWWGRQCCKIDAHLPRIAAPKSFPPSSQGRCRLQTHQPQHPFISH